jgi:hypothetical protein
MSAFFLVWVMRLIFPESDRVDIPKPDHYDSANYRKSEPPNRILSFVNA